MDTSNITAILVLTTIGSLVGTFLSSLIKSYLTEKGRNLATKQDIELITNKIEGVKESYNIALEDYRTELKKVYDLSKPSLDLTINLDVELIKKISDLNSSIFEFSQLQNYGLASVIFDQLTDLCQFLVKYKVRYSALDGVQDIIDVNNAYAQMIGMTPVNPNSMIELFSALSKCLDTLMSYFLIKIKVNKIVI